MKPRLVHPEPTDAEIQHAAYLLWEEAGRPAGRDLEIWLAAKELIRHRAPDRKRAPRGPVAGQGLSENSIQAILAD